MTVDTQQTTGMFLRAEFQEYVFKGQPNVNNIADTFRSINSLAVYAGIVAGQRDSVRRLKPVHFRGQPVLRRINEAEADARGIRVIRISYNSPLEVILAIPPASTALYIVGRQMLSLYNGYQDSKRKKSDTKLYVEANSYLRSLLPVREPFKKQFDTDSAKNARRQLREIENGAGQALQYMKRFEEVDNPERDQQ